MYILSIFFPGYHNVGGYHNKYSIQNFYEKIKKAGIKEDSITKWFIGWQRFTIPGMELESQYSNGLPIPSCVEFKVIPHVMTPLKAFKFLYNLVPEGEQVLFLDFLFFDLPSLENIVLSNQKNIEARIVFQENSMFFYDTLVYFKKSRENIRFNEKDEFTIKIFDREEKEEQGEKESIQRKLVSIEEIAILEFYTSKYPTINDSSAKIIQYLGGKLNINIDFDSLASKELEDFVFNSCKSLISNSCKSLISNSCKSLISNSCKSLILPKDDAITENAAAAEIKEKNKTRPRIVF